MMYQVFDSDGNEWGDFVGLQEASQQLADLERGGDFGYIKGGE